MSDLSFTFVEIGDAKVRVDLIESWSANARGHVTVRTTTGTDYGHAAEVTMASFERQLLQLLTVGD